MKELITAILASLAQPQLITQGSKDVLALPPGWETESLQKLRDNPDRIEAKVSITGVDGFLAYVNRFKDATSSVFVTPNLTRLANGATLATVHLDYHREGVGGDEAEASWLGHTVDLIGRPSLPYAKLLQLDGQLLDQPQFAQALEDIARFSSSHAAAELVEIARTISLTSKGDFKSFEDELSGSVDFRFDLAVRASAGTQERKLSVPAVISFAIPLIDGLPPVMVQAKFVYRVPDAPGGKVSLGIKIVDRVWLEEAAIHEVAASIQANTGLPVYVGSL